MEPKEIGIGEDCEAGESLAEPERLGQEIPAFAGMTPKAETRVEEIPAFAGMTRSECAGEGEGAGQGPKPLVEGEIPAFAGMTIRGESTTEKRDTLSHGERLLRVPMVERPVCGFERLEYEAVVSDVMRRSRAWDPDHGWGVHLAHQIALLSVMVSRAARALGVSPLTDRLEQRGAEYLMTMEKPSAALQAFEKVSRELRRWVAMLELHYPERVPHEDTRREVETLQEEEA